MMKPRDRESILVDSTFSSGTVRSRITVSKDLRKYFKHFEFWSRYDAEIFANSSILNIPVLSIVLPLAWVTGADVHVRELDRGFAKSAEAVHRDYKRMYPKLPFRTKLVAHRLVDNKYESKGDVALLFSGGLDSTYSLFSNIARNPRLVMIFGTWDIPLSNAPLQERLEKEYSAFAKREKLTLNIIRTNAMELLNLQRLDHRFGRLQEKILRCYWEGIGYMLCHIGQAAPLSIGRFDRLLVATGAIPVPQYPYPPDWIGRSSDDRIGWANIDVECHGDMFRHEKVFLLKEFLLAHRSKLRVCLNTGWSREISNCSKCHKCLLTMISLVAAGIDPVTCGFRMDQSTFSRTLRMICNTDAKFMALLWKPLQQAIPDVITLNDCKARRFFEWFKTTDLDSIGRRDRSIISNLYHKSPYLIARTWSWYRTRRLARYEEVTSEMDSNRG